MSSKIFAFAQSAYKKADKIARKTASTLGSNEEEEKEIYQTIYNNEIVIAKNEFNRILDLSEELHEQYLLKYNKQWLFITIRPDESKLTFFEFTTLVDKYINRKTIKNFTLSYEQKGTSEDTIGKGFHCHIVANTTWRSKGEALRDTFSTFNKICAKNCIQVDRTNNPESIIENYLIEYKSDDDHKSLTKEWDDLWRKKYNIQNVYNNENVVVEGPKTPVYQVQKTGVNTQEPIIVSFG